MDRHSVAQLIEQHYPGLLLLMRRKIRDEQLAADVLNDAIVTALEHVSTGRVSEPALIAGYVFQVAMNHARNHRRKFSERADLRADAAAMENVADQHDSPAPRLDTAFAASRIREIITGLPTPRDREVVTRFYLDEDEKDAICRDLKLSALHFDKVIFRARQRMKALLEARGLRKSDFLSVLLCFA